MIDRRTSRVLFIVGKGRSGSTIVGDVLGTRREVFHVGEVWRLWSHGILGPHSCSCGLRVQACPLWSVVLDRLASGPARWAVESPEKVVDMQRDLFGFGGVARAITTGRYRSLAKRYRKLMGDVYEIVSQETGVDLLVDSSKWPLDPSLLTSSPRIEPFALHLVRDPRAVSQSWKKEKTFPDSKSPMPRFGSLHTAASWTARTIAAEAVVRHLSPAGLTMRLEDFLDKPEEKLTEIGRLVGQAWGTLLDQKGAVTLTPGHTVMGNPSRFLSGRVTLDTPTRSEDRIVGALTWPWRRRFGY